MNKRKLGNIFIALGVLLILGAGGLYTYNVLEERRADAEANKIALELVEDIRLAPEETRPVVMSEEELYNQMNGVLDLTMDTVEIDGHEYIGVLSIPSLDLQLPVMAEWSYPSLRIAPCRYIGSVGGNNLVIAAHNYKRHFGMLKTLGMGEEVAFTDVHNVTTVYEIAEIEELQPTDIKDMTVSDFDLSLFTCTYGGRLRYTVRCSRKEF